MAAGSIRGKGLFPVLLALAGLAYWWLHPKAPEVITTGYISETGVPLWNTLAQVRQQVAELHYGDRVEILRQEGTSARVRTAAGAIGWMMDSRQIMSTALWQEVADLSARTRTLPVQARGVTKTVSNVRIEPGRDAGRIFQFVRGTPVVVLERKVVDAPQASEEPPPEESTPKGQDRKPKREDWFLVQQIEDGKTGARTPLATPGTAASGGSSDSGPGVNEPSGAQVSASSAAPPPIAGWVLARFIELDLPGPLRDYATSAAMHVIAWFELDRVPDGSGGQAAQYLVAGAHPGEGQACDFTMLRVYTWGAARRRYETAYVENNLCGQLPVRVSSSPAGPEFRFQESGDDGAEKVYAMRQTVVRRQKQAESRGARPRR